MAKKKKLPAPQDPDAAFCTVCPGCDEDGTLSVINGIFRVQGMTLHEDGFAFADAQQVETEAEKVFCSDCGKTFNLSEVTR